MGGPGSGRNVWRETEKQAELRQACITMGWSILRRFLWDTKRTDEEKLEKVVSLLGKTIPQELKTDLAAMQRMVFIFNEAKPGDNGQDTQRQALPGGVCQDKS